MASEVSRDRRSRSSRSSRKGPAPEVRAVSAEAVGADVRDPSKDRPAVSKLNRAIGLIKLGRVAEAADIFSAAPPTDGERRALLVRCAGAIREGRREEGAAFARLLMTLPPGTAEDAALLGRLMMRIGDVAASEAQTARAGNLAPDNLQFATRRILGFLRGNRVEDAADLAAQYVDHCQKDAQLARVCLIALSRANRLDAAAPLIDRLLQGEESGGEVLLFGAQILLQQDRAADALTLCRKAFAAGPVTPRMHLTMAQALLALDTSLEEVTGHLEAAQAAAPDDLAVLKTLGEVLLMLGRYENAVPILKKAVELGPTARNIRLLYARALKFSRRYNEAADVIISGLQAETASKTWKRQATALLLQAGRDKEAIALYSDMLGQRRASLDKDFASHLQRLESQPDNDAIPSARLEWAWKVATRWSGALPALNRVEWERKARWGLQADLAILDWLECRPQNISEIIALLNDPRRSVQPGFDLLKQGKGMFIASAHLGPMYAGPVVLLAGGLPFKVVASTPRIASAAYAQHLISTVDQTEVMVVRQVMAALNRGHAVTITVDGAMNPAAPRVKWEGASVTYSDFVAALSFRLQVPSVFAQPYWKDGKIAFRIRPLPDPSDAESEEVYIEKWRTAFFHEIGTYFSLGPENLRLSGGIWRHISSTHADSVDQ